MSKLNTERNFGKVLMPIDLIEKEGVWHVVCLKTNVRFYREPFFLDSMDRHYGIGLTPIGEEGNLVRSIHYLSMQSIHLFSIDDFIAYAGHAPGLKNLFIFHISRSGSTLITQMLSQSELFFVLSEPPFVNKTLDPKLPLTDHQRKQLLKSGINQMLKCAPSQAQAAVIKFRSWNTLFLPLIVGIYPFSPWLFLHRNGLEVMASVQKNPPGWLRSQRYYAGFFANQLNLPTQYVENCDQSEFIARILGLFCKIAASHSSYKSLCLDYTTLPDSVRVLVENILCIDLTYKEYETLYSATHLYSKDSTKTKQFLADSDAKVQSLSPHSIDMILNFMEVERKLLI